MCALCIEQVLDDAFLLNMGKYARTCAHIELMAFKIVSLLSGLDQKNKQQIIKMHKKRKNTNDLLAELKNLSNGVDGETGKKLRSLCDNIKESGIRNRNTAIHGAWSKNGEIYNVDYSWNANPKGMEENWFEFKNGFTVDFIDYAVKDGDRILRELVSILEAIKQEKNVR